MSRLYLIEARGKALFGFRYRLVRLCLFAGTVFAVPGSNRASCFLAQFLASFLFCSEKPRLTLASDLGKGNFLVLTDPSGFVVEKIFNSVGIRLVGGELSPLGRFCKFRAPQLQLSRVTRWV